MLLGIALPGPHPLSELIGKYLRSCGRMLVDAQDERPKLLIPILHPLLEFFTGCLTQTSARLPEPLIVFSLVFVRSVVECYEYKEEQAVAAQITAFFSDQLVTQLAERCMTEFMCLTQDDLESWQRSGEEFFVEEVRCAWLERTRPAAEILMGTLLRTHTARLAPIIAQAFNQALASANLHISLSLPPSRSPSSNTSLSLPLSRSVYHSVVAVENLNADKRAWAMQMEVLYNVISMAPAALEKLVSLEGMMAGIELHIAEQNAWYRLLRRRIASIFGALYS